MTGLEIVAATYLFKWAKQRGKKAGEQVGAEVDNAFELAMDRLHQLVVAKLGAADRQLKRLEDEAGQDREEPKATTVKAVASALEAEASGAPDFAEQLAAVVAAVQKADPDSAALGAVHNDFRNSTFHGPVQGSGTQHITFHQ